LTLRATILGLLAAIFIVVAGYINDQYIRVNFMVGNHLPISVFGMLILGMVLVNPLLWKLRASWRLRPAELAVALSLTLVACNIPSSGLMRTFTPTLVMPIHHDQITPGWQKTNVLQYAPPQMLAGGGRYDPALIDNFISGLGEPGRAIGLDRVPWGQWNEALTTWLPLIFLCTLAVICMSLIVHQQWAYGERLRYPIADFATSLLNQEPGKALGPIFRQKFFWIGLAAVLLIRLVNGLHVWFPDRGIEIPLQFDFSAIARRFPAIGRAPGSGDVVRPILYPTGVAFAFFLASDVGFSLGISRIAYVLIMGWLITLGANTTGDYMNGGLPQWLNFGSYVGMGVLLLYTGRRHYGQLALSAIPGLGGRFGSQRYGVWATRLFILATLGMIFMLAKLGLDWPLAVLAVGLILLMFLVIARVNAEGGVFFYKPMWQTPGIFIGLFGLAALGPKATIIIGMLTMVLTIDPREALIPFLINALKISDDQHVPPGRIGWAAAGVFALCLAIVLPVALWANYNFGLQEQAGGGGSNPWATTRVPKFPFDAAAMSITKLELTGELEQSVGFSALDRLRHMHPSGTFLLAAGIGCGLLLATSALRLRYTWWPLHPIFFLVFGIWVVGTFAASFLLGWIIKTIVTKVGGAPSYHKTKTMMVGVIAGDLLGGLVFMLVGWIYYGVTGAVPPSYRIFPG